MSGVIVELLEFIPENSLGVQYREYRLEVLAIQDNRVRSVKAWKVDSESSDQPPLSEKNRGQ